MGRNSTCGHCPRCQKFIERKGLVGLGRVELPTSPLSVRQSIIAAIGLDRHSPCIHAGLVRIWATKVCVCGLMRILAYPRGYATKKIENHAGGWCLPHTLTLRCASTWQQIAWRAILSKPLPYGGSQRMKGLTSGHSAHPRPILSNGGTFFPPVRYANGQ